MSADGDGDAGPGSREVAYRPFAAEFDDSSLSYSESDEERAPNYVVTPTGLRVNRLFAVGVLTEVEAINDETLRGRIVDPTGAFVTYAGQYQPEAQAFLDRTTPPAFVAITGKARTFEPEDSDRVFTSVRPESLSEVAGDTRDRWVVSAAESTLHRIAVCAAARDSGIRGEALEDALSEAGVDTPLATGIPRALDHYGTTTAYLEALRQLAVEALELVADEREEVTALDLAPGDGGEADLGPLPKIDLDLSGSAPPVDEADPADQEPVPADDPETAVEADDSPSTEPASTAGTDTVEDEVSSSAESPAEPTVDTVDATESATETMESAELESAATNGAADSEAEADTADTGDVSDQDAEDPGMYQLDEEEREELESEYGSGFSTGNEVDPAGEADIDVPDADELAEQAEAEDAATDTMGNETTAEPTADEGGLGEFDDGVGDFQDTSDTTATDTASDEESTAAADTEATPETEPIEESTDTGASGDTTDDAADPTADTAEETAGTTEATGSETDTSTDEPAAEDIDLEDTVVETMAEMDDGDGVGRDELVAHVTDTYGVEETAVEEAIADALMGGRCYEPGDDQLKAI